MVKKAKSKWIEIPKFVSIAAILVVVATLLATVCLITSSKAGGEAGDRKTAALGFMMLRLESSTETSNYLTRAQMCTTLADIALARSEATDNTELKMYLENAWYNNMVMANFYADQAVDAENRSQSYYDAYENALDSATAYGKVADYRSTGALIFTVSATLASLGVLLKMKEILYIYIPIFAIGLFYLIISFL
jgi:hypothetical protein